MINEVEYAIAALKQYHIEVANIIKEYFSNIYVIHK